MIMNFGSLIQPKFDQSFRGSSKEIVSSSNIFPRRSIKNQSKLITSILNDAISPNRPTNRKVSNNTQKSKLNNSMLEVVKELSMIRCDDNLRGQEDIVLDDKIRSITNEHVDYDIDRQFIFKVFFPIYNFTVILQKVNSFYEEKI